MPAGFTSIHPRLPPGRSSCPSFPPCGVERCPALSPRYMVDAADQEKIEASKNELHNLLDKPQLQGIPVSRRMGWEGRVPTGSRRTSVRRGRAGGRAEASPAALNPGLPFLLCRS